MLRIHSFGRDRCFYDTHKMEPGQQVDFLGADCNIGECHRTNMEGRYVSKHRPTIIHAFGLRILGLSRDEEDPLLDHFFVAPTLGDTPYGGLWPGILCSTLRHASEEHADDPPDDPTAYLPGKRLSLPITVALRQSFSLYVTAAKTLPRAVDVRAMAFALECKPDQLLPLRLRLNRQ